MTQETKINNSELGLERIVFFSDAVMAIAITLLAIDLKLPEIVGVITSNDLQAMLSALTPRIMSFVISFVAIGVYWRSHHRYFTYIKRYDNVLITLNLLFLGFIAVMPFVASILGQFAYLPMGVIIYASALAAIGFAIGGLWWYATADHRLVDADLDEDLIRSRRLIALIVPVIFLLEIPFALISPWLGLTVWWVVPFVAFILQRFTVRRRRR
jgi:uncharacterized membrane protein